MSFHDQRFITQLGLPIELERAVFSLQEDLRTLKKFVVLEYGKMKRSHAPKAWVWDLAFMMGKAADWATVQDCFVMTVKLPDRWVQFIYDPGYTTGNSKWFFRQSQDEMTWGAFVN